MTKYADRILNSYHGTYQIFKDRDKWITVAPYATKTFVEEKFKDAIIRMDMHANDFTHETP